MRGCAHWCTLKARSAPGQDTRIGQGALARRHTDGPLWAALLKTTVMCEAWHRGTIAPSDPFRLLLCDFSSLGDASPRHTRVYAICRPELGWAQTIISTVTNKRHHHHLTRCLCTCVGPCPHGPGGGPPALHARFFSITSDLSIPYSGV